MPGQPENSEYHVITFGDIGVDLVVSSGDIVMCFGVVEQLIGNYAVEMRSSCCILACQATRLG
jgi:hypothetical protein